MELDDVGKQVVIDIYRKGIWKTITLTVVMGIKAPRGKMFLFEQPLLHGKVYQTKLCHQCMGIRAFMKQHRKMPVDMGGKLNLNY